MNYGITWWSTQHCLGQNDIQNNVKVKVIYECVKFNQV